MKRVVITVVSHETRFDTEAKRKSEMAYSDYYSPNILCHARTLFYFISSFIGYSSSNINMKFIIQHKNKRKEAKPKKGRCNGTNVPCEAPPLD